MDEPYSAHDPLTGERYEVFCRHEDKPGRPLVFYAGLGTVATGSATSRIWRNYMAAFADAVDGPVMHLHPVRQSRPWRSFASRAESDAAVLDQLGVEAVDITGVSSGGLLAAYVAAGVGERAMHLVTASAVGTREARDYVSALPAQVADSAKTSLRVLRRSGVKDAGGTGVGKLMDVSHYPEVVRTIRQAAQAPLDRAIDGLSPETRWTTIVGTRDALTSSSEHAELVARRNESAPGSAELIVAKDMAHVWSSRPHELARLVARAIATDSST